MPDTYWDPIFARLVDDLDCVRLMAENLPDRALLEPIRGNPTLWKQVQVFAKGDRFVNRPRALEAILRSAASEQPLRRIILWSWVKANEQTLKFVTLPIDRDGEKRLLQGEFGNLAKLTILARIDPRESAKPLYEKVLARLQAESPTAAAGTMTPTSTAGPSPAGRDAAASGERPGCKDETARSEAAKTPAIHEELKAIGKELEQTRAELRDLRRQLKALEEDRRQWEKRFLERSQEAETLKKRVAELNQSLAKTQTDRASLEKGKADVEAQMAALKTRLAVGGTPAAAVAGEGASDESSSNALLDSRRRVEELEDLVARRDKALQRRDEETAQLRRDLNEARETRRREERRRTDLDEVSRQLSRWQQARLARLYHRWQEGDRGAPHLVWELLNGEYEITPCAAAECAARTEGEFVLLLGRDDASAGDSVWEWHPLETPREEGIVGIVESTDAGPRLVTSEAEYPIQTTLPALEPGVPVAGRLLNAFGERPAGVRALRPLRSGAETRPTTSMSWKALAEFLRLEQVDLEALRRQVEKQSGPWKAFPDRIEFDRDARTAAAGLRLCLPIVAICDRPSCLQQETPLELFRRARPGEVCQICREEVGAEESAKPRASWNFHDARVLLVGGDEVGTVFQAAGAKHRLQITWVSGFGHLEPHAAGLETYDLTAVIVRQVSHTLVRELTAAVRKRHARLAFLKRRGVSGVLNELAALLKASREE